MQNYADSVTYRSAFRRMRCLPEKVTRKEGSMSIRCITAVYGTKKHGNDVTDIVQKRLDAGNDDVLVDNDHLGGDPDVGTVKNFGILYELPGGKKDVRCGKEHDRIELVD